MGGLVIETIRPGVQFIPDAAAAFRRAEAQVQNEFKRNIDVNSTYRTWAQQLKWHQESVAYNNGTGPYPGHSWAVHPSESFHVGGTALDSDDWTNARIVAILAANGFIRNRLYVKNENHHFEYIKNQDKNYGKDIDVALTSEEIKRIAAETAKQVWRYELNGKSAGERLRTQATNSAKAVWAYIIGSKDSATYSYGEAGTVLSRADARAGKAAVRAQGILDGQITSDEIQDAVANIVIEAGEGLSESEITNAVDAGFRRGIESLAVKIETTDSE